MNKKIIGATVGTTMSPSEMASKVEEKINPVKTVNGKAPDANGNVEVEIPENTIITETDPTVPTWAKQPTKPSYTNSEVGLGNVDNVRQYSADNPPPYPVASVNGKTGVVTLAASDVGARPSSWTPTYSDVGADKSGTASTAISSHNTNTAAHNDLRLLIEGLSTRLNALANSTDNDLDQMAEVVAYIKANKQLIDSITTSKVSVADIVDNLSTNVTNRPLSAAQGVALKALIDAITVPTKVSQLENDAKYLTSFTETDPTVPSWAKQSTKPSYSKSEVGLGNVDNVKQYSANNPPPYPVTKVNNKTGAVTLSASDVGADASGTASSAVSTHNTNISAHADIRNQISQLSSEKVDKNNIFLDIASDGLMHIFINGDPVGPGVARGGGDDVFGYVDENNVVVLSSNLPTGAYTIKYEMADGSLIDIGSLVLDNNVYYSITNNLTNCTTNNTALQVVEGESYTATISANSGYELKSVSVTMGGSPVSVSGGIINISNVTGDIVITAVAEEIRVEITNLIPTLTDVDLSTIYNGTGYKENTRISISAISDSNPTGEKTQAGTTLLGIMPLGNDGDVLHLSGAKFFNNTGGNTYSGLIWCYNASGTLLNTGTISVPDTGLLSTDANGDATFTMTHSKMKLIDGTAYIRLNITNPTGELIMTRNQLIPQN